MPDKIAKFIESLNPKIKKRLKEKLLALKKNPFAGDVIKLRGFQGKVYRLRIGKIRIIYQIKEKEIEIIDIDFRGNIY